MNVSWVWRQYSGQVIGVSRIRDEIVRLLFVEVT